MFGGAGPAIGNHWGIGSLTDGMYDDAIVGMRASAQKAIDEEAMLRLSASRQASERWAQRQAALIEQSSYMAQREALMGCSEEEWRNSGLPEFGDSNNIYDYTYSDPTFKRKEQPFKEKLQEETDEWLDKVLD